MYKLRVIKKKAYSIHFKLYGDFSDEALRTVNLTDVSEVELIADVGVEWDYDIPMTFIDGDIYIKGHDDKWENGEKFLELTGTRYLIEEYIEDMVTDFDSDYRSDLQAAAADFRMDNYE